MIYRTSKEEIQKYYDDSAMNQSLLKTLIRGPHAFTAAQQIPERVLYYQEKGHLIIGSAADCYISMGEEEFRNTYHIEDGTKKPKSEKIMSIIKMAFDKATELEFVNVEDFFSSEAWFTMLHASCDANEYYMNRKKTDWKIDGRLDLVKNDNYSNYIKSLLDAQGKQILTDEENNKIAGIIMSWTTHPYVKDYITPVNENVDIYFQLPIYFTYRWQEQSVVEGVDLTEELPEYEEDAKALIDILIADHIAKTLQPADLKTTEGDCYWFLNKLKQFNYHIQAAYYLLAIEAWKQNTFNMHQLDSNVKDLSEYTILPFKFIVESTELAIQGNPLVFKCTTDLINIGLTGRPKCISPLLSIEGDGVAGIVYQEIKGIQQLFSDYRYYKENGFSKRREIKEGNHFDMSYQDITPIEFVPIND